MIDIFLWTYAYIWWTIEHNLKEKVVMRVVEFFIYNYIFIIIYIYNYIYL